MPSAPESLAENPSSQKVGTVSPQLSISPDRLLNSLSYSHFEQLVAIDDSLKRAFYEVECPARRVVGSRTQTPDRQPLLRAIRTIQRQSGFGQTCPVDGRTQRTKSDSTRPGGLQSREPWATQYLPELVCSERTIRQRQSARWHSAMHKQERCAREVRRGGNGQPVVRLTLSGCLARQKPNRSVHRIGTETHVRKSHLAGKVVRNERSRTVTSSSSCRQRAETIWSASSCRSVAVTRSSGRHTWTESCWRRAITRQ